MNSLYKVYFERGGFPLKMNLSAAVVSSPKAIKDHAVRALRLHSMMPLLIVYLVGVLNKFMIHLWINFTKARAHERKNTDIIMGALFTCVLAHGR